MVFQAKKTADDIADEKGHTVIKELLNDKHAEIAAKWKRGAKKARVCSIQQTTLLFGAKENTFYTFY